MIQKEFSSDYYFCMNRKQKNNMFVGKRYYGNELLKICVWNFCNNKTYYISEAKEVEVLKVIAHYEGEFFYKSSEVSPSTSITKLEYSSWNSLQSFSIIFRYYLNDKTSNFNN